MPDSHLLSAASWSSQPLRLSQYISLGDPVSAPPEDSPHAEP
jgi:hypothetical protein